MTTEAEQRLEAYSSQATESDIEIIRRRLSGMNRGPIKKLWRDVIALWRMVTAPDAKWATRAIAIGALLYLVSPFDGVPDILPLLGLADDAAVIAAAVGLLFTELQKYRKSKELPEAPVEER